MAARNLRSTIDDFVERVRSERVAAGQPEYVTEPTVYSIIDGIIEGRQPTSDRDRAARRRRAAQRSQGRVPYSDTD